MIYLVTNQGQLNIGHGIRSVLILPPGRKWVTVIDWSHPHLETTKTDLRTWEGLRPVPVPLTPRLRRHIKRRMQDMTIKRDKLGNVMYGYVEKTNAIKEALAAL